MRTFSFFSILMLYAGLGPLVQAAPVMVAGLRETAETYSLFYIDPKKLRGGLSVAQEQALLTEQLTALTPPLKPCFSSGNLNITNLRCGSGTTQMQLGSGEIYSYNLESLLLAVPITLDRGVTPIWFANFLAPDETIPGDNLGRVARIHFTGRMAQFGMLVDPGINGSLSNIQFIVNGQALPPKPMNPGAAQFVGVEDKQGFTDITIIAGGATRAFVADKLAFLPLAKF